ncbi:MAG TPA: hypothetical protein VGR31_17435 [Planctomycetota bacterium]|jgi:hypothetical protein|nr:hypothetical protein [Planctomycetota bacterium]
MGVPRRAARPQIAALAAIVVLAALLRCAGLGRELPHRVEPDAFIAYQLQSFESDPALVQGVRYADRYPSLVARALALLPYPAVPAQVAGAGAERAHLAAAARPFLLVRATVALFSVLGVLATWFLARRFLAPGAALLAALFAATSLLALLFAGQARPHGIQATLALAAVLCALRVRERATPARIALGVLAAAAAAAALQNGLFTLPPLALAVVLGSRRRIAACAAAGGACLAAAAAAFAFYPGLPYVDAHGVHLGPDQGGAHWIQPSLANLGGIPALTRLLWEHDPLLLALAPIGAIVAFVAVRRRRALADAGERLDLAVVLAYVVPYAGVLALDPNVHDRFLLPLIPYLACLAAAALAWLFAGAHRAVALAAGAALVAVPLVVASCFARTAASPDTLERAADWIRREVDPKERILTTPGTVLPLLVEADTLREDLEDPTELTLPWIAYQRLLPPTRGGDRGWKLRLLPVARRFDPHNLDVERAKAWIRETGADLVLVEDSQRIRSLYSGDAIERAARELGELVYRSDGRIPALGDTGPIEYQGARDLAKRLLTADAFGPGILVFRIHR